MSPSRGSRNTDFEERLKDRLRAIDHVTRGSNESADVHLKGRDEVLPVGLSYLHLFREM